MSSRRLPANVPPPSRQRGWAGIIMLLVALVIVAWLAKDALKGYGLAPASGATTRAGTPAERARAPGAVGIDAFEPGAAPVGAPSALDRARGVEDMLKQQATERAQRSDGTTQ